MARQFRRQYLLYTRQKELMRRFNFLYWNNNFVVSNQKTDNNGRILSLDVTFNDVSFVSINLYNANTETKQVSVLNNLSSLLENFDVTLEENLILAGDFNLFLNSKLDAKGGKPAIKKILS